MHPAPPDPTAVSTAHRVRSVLAIPAFRRLWGVTALCAVGDWLSLLALSALATQLTEGYSAQSFALGGVVATKLLPALVLGPLAGALADKLDRRRVMVVCDVLRAGLFLSIPAVGSLTWLFVATFLIECCTLFWIPAKDAAVPNLLRRPDQVETATQLGLVMTYGGAVLVASGLFAVLSKAGPALSGIDLGSGELLPAATNSAYFALAFNGLAYALCAVVVALRIPEISGRPTTPAGPRPGVLAMLREGAVFVRGSRLVRGLVVGIIGAFAAGGAVIATAKLYAASLGGGDAAYGLLFGAMFAGLGLGMALAPQAARRTRRERLFGVSIVAAGLALVLVALSPHLFVAFATVALVGGAAGVAFLTGLTIIGTRVDDAVRGRTIAFVQAIVRVVLLTSLAVVPVAVGLLQQRTVPLLGERVTVDGTRPVLAVAGLCAVAVGAIAHRMMGERRGGSLWRDLRTVVCRDRRRGGEGLLVSVEGVTPAETAAHAEALTAYLREHSGRPVVADDPAAERVLFRALTGAAGLTSARARTLAAAAVRAEVVEHVVRPALAAGHVVVVQHYAADPLDDAVDTADRGAPADPERGLTGLTDLATDRRLAPDLTVLLDRDRATSQGPEHWGEQHWQLQRVLTEMAAADPSRYLVVDADSDPARAAERVGALVLQRAGSLPPAAVRV